MFTVHTSEVSLDTKNYPSHGSVNASRGDAGARLLAIGFGTTVAMWAVGYVGHQFAQDAAKWPFLALVLLISILGGAVAGRHSGKIGTGVWAGLITGLLNLLVVGSILGDIMKNARVNPDSNALPSIAVFGPGSILTAMILSGLGAAIGKHFPAKRIRDWPAVFGWISILATLLLIFAGGLVTGHKAGLAVPDWPNSFGSNMFLYPLSAMTGGIFYEHAHRLLGSLVGFTILTLAVYVTKTDRRPLALWLVWIAFGMVALQGLMGGLRVTGKLTLSADAAVMSPSTTLAVIHGIFAHVVLGVLVAITAVISHRWKADVAPLPHPGASTDRTFNWLLAGLIVLQSFLGALVRHVDWGVMMHITLAGIVAVLALTCGMRAVAIFTRVGPMRRAGIGLMIVVAIQLILGVIALVFRKPISQTEIDFGTALVTTAHQTNGAIMLAVSTSLAVWTLRELKFDPDAADWNVPATAEVGSA